MTNYIQNNLISQVHRGGTVSSGKPNFLAMSFQELLIEKMEQAIQMNQQLQSNNTGPSIQYSSPLPMGANNNFNGFLFHQNREQALSGYQANQAWQHNDPSLPITDTKLTTHQPPTNQYNSLIEQAAQKYRVDANLIHAIIKMESNYNPNVKSHAGAVGLMQLMPSTAQSVGITNRYDIAQNIDGGVNYFSKMLKNQNGNIALALASYNAGPGNVKKYGGIPPFKETQNYVSKVMDYYQNIS